MWDSVADWFSTFWTDNRGVLIGTAIVMIGTYILVRVVRRGIRRWEKKVESQFTESSSSADRERGQRLITIADVLNLTASIVLYSIGLLTLLSLWGVPMTAFIAVGSTIGVAIGFGAQDVVGDILAGFLILIEDQYAIGDVVRIAGVEGTVEGIKLRTTVLRDINGERHYVPNGQIQVASNLTSEFSRLVVDVPVSYDTDLDRASQVILEEANAFAYSDDWRADFLEPPELLGVNKLGDSAIDIRLLMTLTSEARWRVKRAFLKQIKERMDREGISIPFNHIRVLVSELPDDEGTSDSTGSQDS